MKSLGSKHLIPVLGGCLTVYNNFKPIGTGNQVELKTASGNLAYNMAFLKDPGQKNKPKND